MKKEFDYLIVGAGLFGAVFAREATDRGKRCLVIEKRRHPGGNIYCDDVDGIYVHCYGAHIFHTDKESVWSYVNRFVRFNHYINSPLAYYKGRIYNLPFNMNTFNQLWGVRTPAEAQAKLVEQRSKYQYIDEPANLEEQALKLAGDDIYYTFIKEYTEKQWGRPAAELPAFIIRRLPFRFIYDNNYFNDPYQGIPVNGYNALIDALLDGVDVCCGADYFANRAAWDARADKIVFTGCIDAFFDYAFGELEYRSLHFEHERLNADNFQGNAVVNYNEACVPYTRIIEHKHFNFGKQPFTVITREYPRAFLKGGEPYYPVNDDRNMRLLARYRERAAMLPHVCFGGRLAQYAYMDMDDTVEAALTLACKELT